MIRENDMSKIAVVTDSNSGITQKPAERIRDLCTSDAFLLMVSYILKTSH